MKITKKLITLALAALMLLSLAVPALADDSDFIKSWYDEKVLAGYKGPGGDVVIPDRFTAIEDSAFSGCTSITSVTIPASVTSFSTGNNFAGCTSLTDVYYAGTEEQWNKMTGNIWYPIFGGGSPTMHYNSTGPTAPTTPTTPEPTPSTPEPTPTTPTTPSFSDVPANAWYAAPVAWALEKGITNGTGENTFSPNKTCNTAEILTFLWRACDKPEAEAAGFSDVAANAWYADAANWAKSKGMVSGSTLSPNTRCTRASAVMFIWQAKGSPEATEKASFTDVPADADYAAAVAWAVENGITNGTGTNTFSPDDICTRGHIVTFLQRAFA